MLSFLRRLFSYNRKSKYGQGEPVLDLGIPAPPKQGITQDADVHKLMIKATRIRRQEGYTTAIAFLKDLVEEYISSSNTALVTCMNKLVPYMKREGRMEYRQIHSYVAGVIERSPIGDPYFQNLHLTMADLMRSENIDETIEYLLSRIAEPVRGRDDFGFHITLAELFTEKGSALDAGHYLGKARLLLNPNSERFGYIRNLRKWFRTRAGMALLDESRKGCIAFLENRLIEFCLDMARVIDPLRIDRFHERKDLYYKKERGFEDTEAFRKAILGLSLDDRKDALLEEVYGFAFEELPLIMKITKKQLRFAEGDEENLEELLEKKKYARKPFTELQLIEDNIHKLLGKYI